MVVVDHKNDPLYDYYVGKGGLIERKPYSHFASANPLVDHWGKDVYQKPNGLYKGAPEVPGTKGYTDVRPGGGQPTPGNVDTPLIWKMFPTHGNYGGPNWSAGKFGGDPNGMPVEPVGPFDFAYYEHDLGYARAKSTEDIIRVDDELRDALAERLTLRTLYDDPVGYVYSSLARQAFLFKKALHGIGINAGTVSGEEGESTDLYEADTTPVYGNYGDPHDDFL